jgi:hypothetical protein
MRYRDLILKRFQTEKEPEPTNWYTDFLAAVFVPIFPGVRSLSPGTQAALTQSFAQLLRNTRREEQGTYAYLGRAFLEGAQALKDFLKADPERIATLVAEVIKGGPGPNPVATLQDWNERLLAQLGIQANPELVQALTMLQLERANMYYKNALSTSLSQRRDLPLAAAIEASGANLRTKLGSWPSAANRVINLYDALRKKER